MPAHNLAIMDIVQKFSFIPKHKVIVVTIWRKEFLRYNSTFVTELLMQNMKK